MSLITPSEFTGTFKVATNQYKDVDTQAYIDQVQPDVLVHLFGVELYNLFLTATTNGTVAPTEARFLTVYNAFQVQDDGSQGVFYTGSAWNPCVQPSVEGGCLPGQNQIHQSFGIKDMLKGFVYFHMNKDGDVQATPTGNRTPESTASKMPGQALRNSRLTGPYNRAIQSYQAIQWYMKYGPNRANYPEYNGIAKGKIFFGGAI